VAPSRASAAVGGPPAWRLATDHALERGWRFRPVVVLRAAIILMLVANLGRIPVLSTGPAEAPLLVNDLAIMAVLAAGLLATLVARSFRLDLVGVIALSFAALGGISAILSVSRFDLTAFELLVSLLYLARWVVYLGIYLTMLNVVREADVMSVWRTLEWMMLVFAGFGIIQAIFIPHFAQVVYPNSRVFLDWDEQGNRLVSTVLEPNVAGIMIVLVLLVELAQLAAAEPVKLWKPLVLVTALAATVSRSSFLALFVGVIPILLVRGVSRRLLRVAAAVAILSIPVLPAFIRYAASLNKFTIDESALSRVASWLRALRVFADSPIIGVGFNTYGYVQERYGYERLGLFSNSSDGGLLFIAVLTGVVGVSLYLLMLGTIVVRCRQLWRDRRVAPQHRALATGVAAGTFAVCVHSVFVNSLLITFVMEPLWILWALVSIVAFARVPVTDEARVWRVAHQAAP
jgi:O-antigen ligase